MPPRPAVDHPRDRRLVDLAGRGFIDLNIYQIKQWLCAKVTAAGYVAILSDSRMAETQRALQVQKAFQQVPDNPDAAKALEHSAMKALLELAADWCGQIRAESGGEHGHRRRNIRGGSRST